MISIDTVHTAFGNRSYYWCDTIEDMCRINAKLGDYANVRGTVYMYNGGSWTKTDKTNPTACLDCAYLETNCGCAILRQDELTGDRCQYWRSFVDKPSRREREQKSKYVPYFKSLPVTAFSDCFYTLGTAFHVAWLKGVKYIWLNGRFVDGNPKPGDTFEVRGTHWKLYAREYKDDTGYERYLLQRMDDDNG